jgi:hypothetical protein
LPLLAEEVVQEWLKRQGYFTIRGIKAGNSEIDLLAVRVVHGDGPLRLDCRHVEVHVSHNPIKYITRTSAKRVVGEELCEGVEAWVTKKWKDKRKEQIRQRLAPGDWSLEFVVHRYKHPEEIELMREYGITIVSFADVVHDLKRRGEVVPVAGGADIMGLILLMQDGRPTAREELAEVLSSVESDDD